MAAILVSYANRLRDSGRLRTLRKVTLARGAPVVILSVRAQIGRNPGSSLTTTGVVNDLLYDTPNVTITLRLCQLALCPS